MSRIKQDLISEIIRLSQTNLLDKKCGNMSSEYQEQAVMDWVRKNAADYRVDFQSRLDVYSASKLGEILNCLLYTSPSPRDRTRSRMPSSA